MSADKRRRARVQGGWSAPPKTKLNDAPPAAKNPTGPHPHPLAEQALMSGEVGGPGWLGKTADAPIKETFVYHNPGEASGDCTDWTDFIERIKELRLKTAKSITDFKFNEGRVRELRANTEFPKNGNGILYWMSRDQRVQDNWAFLYAQKLALNLEMPLHVCFCLVPHFLEATIRHYGFMLKGLQEVQRECDALDISFHLLIGFAKDAVPKFVKDHSIAGVVTDFSPLRTPTQWVNDVKDSLPHTVPMFQVDAHNVVPVWEASPQLETGARSIRGKIKDKLPLYFTDFPPVIIHPHKAKSKAEPVDWKAAEDSLEVDRTVKEVEWAVPGTTGGLRTLEIFVKSRLVYYGLDRNNPTKNALSNMSPWYHFGQVATQRGMLMVKELEGRYKDGVDVYLEEGIIRRELAENFCFYSDKYDSVEGTNDWALKTLNDHRGDKREAIYSRQQLEQALSHDGLWNAAQKQMVLEGKMHGFLRMYWAKKILEWTDTPERALADAIYLNDKYSLDGRDPIGYQGCMWSICGTHDGSYRERPVTGRIRCMTYRGSERKFNVQEIVAKYKDMEIC